MIERYLVTMSGGIRLSTSTMRVMVPIIAGHLRARRTLYCRPLTDITVVAEVSLVDGKPTAVATRHGASIDPPNWVINLVYLLTKEFPQ